MARPSSWNGSARGGGGEVGGKADAGESQAAVAWPVSSAVRKAASSRRVGNRANTSGGSHTPAATHTGGGHTGHDHPNTSSQHADYRQSVIILVDERLYEHR